VGIVSFSPLAMGVLTGKYTSPGAVPPGSRASGPPVAFYSEQDQWKDLPFFQPAVLAAVQRLRPIAEQAKCTMSQLALAWNLRATGVSSVITGASRPEQVSENAAASDLDIEASALEEVSAILAPVADFTAPTLPNMDD
jgi:aryl-alcohol dehydrogenase-like predicted oxidoreductase